MAKVIAPFFKLEAKDILIALKSFRRFNQLFACKSKIKRNFVLTAMKIVNAKKYKVMIIREIPEKRIEENIDVLVNQFIQAANIAVKEIVGYCYSLKNNTEKMCIRDSNNTTIICKILGLRYIGILKYL